MKKIILITSLLKTLLTHGAADSTLNEVFYIINNTRKALYIRVRPDTPEQLKGSEGILRLSQDKSVHILHNLATSGPLRLRIRLENDAAFTYEGTLIKTGNALIITGEKGLDSLARTLKAKHGYNLQTMRINPETTTSLHEPLGEILVITDNIAILKNNLYTLMSAWSSITFESKFETEYILKNNGLFFEPIANQSTQQQNVGPQLDTQAINDLDALHQAQTERQKIMHAVFGHNA